LATEGSIPNRHIASTGSVADRKPVDIIVSVYKSVQLTSRCLESLAAHIHEISNSDPRLIVINDSPGERDVGLLLDSFARRYAYVRVLENESNLGFVRTANRGLDIACKDGRDAILVNADTETFSCTLKNLIEAAYADPQIGFASPRSNNASLCSLPHLECGVTTDQAEAYKRWSVLSRSMPSFHFAPTAVGFYLYIKHSVIANFGFLDPDFGIGYEEENDLICRANKVGFRTVLANHAFAYHAGSASFNLLGIDLRAHQSTNLQKVAERHEEFLPLVRRYEASAHYRAEVLLSHALPTPSGRLKIVFDLAAVGMDFNGTNEMSKAIVGRFYDRHASKFEICVICSNKAFRFHNLDRYPGIRRLETDCGTRERFAIGVQLSQPFSVHALSALEGIALINIFGMLDTIAYDCGYLSMNNRLDAIWGHMSRYANGIVFSSKVSERTFLARFPDGMHVANLSQLLPTRLIEYKTSGTLFARDHVLIMGNHFAHKASGRAAELISEAFPNIRCVVIGKENGVSQNVRTYKAGTLDEKKMEALYRRASVVVLPSYVEGFGFGLLHALAMKKVVVARDIPVTREILSAYKECTGVFLYADDRNIVRAIKAAMMEVASSVNDDGAPGWDLWVDGFAQFCTRLIEQDDTFDRAVRRLEAGDQLRKAELADLLQAYPPTDTVAVEDKKEVEIGNEDGAIADAQGRRWYPARHVRTLLELEGEELIHCAYVSILGRLPDSDGLVNYLEELQSGIPKIEVIARLRNSSEGQRSGRPLVGYRRAVIATRMLSILGVSG